ncbi:MAG: hypothetical protein LBH22_07765 [Bacteroidales bacterium]|jgi:hypothetical protein|nr:hypothetical protein [Bacteroidales bacterium]
MRKFKTREQKRQSELIQSENSVFYGDKGWGEFGVRKYSNIFILQNGKNNLFKEIQNDAIKYFKENGFKWWNGKGDKPTGHVLSSQIACINHLFAIKNDKDTVLEVLQKITKKPFEKVLPIECDEYPAYISFEVVTDKDYLNESKDNQPLTRGSNCTSIDAFILAKLNGKKWLIPIEWKYTEHYGDTKSADKSIESTTKRPNAGKERLNRYKNLISNSKQLKLKKDDYTSSVYFFEPFYQLMRQTLWAEQLIDNEKDERIKADDFLHIHVIPKENDELLEKNYKHFGKNMLQTWQNCLTDKSKYQIVDPFEIVEIIKQNRNYTPLAEYLTQRYYQQA